MTTSPARKAPAKAQAKKAPAKSPQLLEGQNRDRIEKLEAEVEELKRVLADKGTKIDTLYKMIVDAMADAAAAQAMPNLKSEMAAKIEEELRSGSVPAAFRPTPVT